jgi:hypothetical protein
MAKTSQPTRAPNKALYLTDYARSAWDIGALSATLPALARAPRGDGHAVLVIPGLGASDRSTLILRSLLSTLGYATYGLGTRAQHRTHRASRQRPPRTPARVPRATTDR